MKRSLALALALSTTPSFADQRGNGGDVVVCEDAQGAVATVELLDFYEGRSRLGFQVDLATGTTWQEKLAAAITKLGRVDPDRARSYRAAAETFEDDTHFWPGVVLRDIPDSAHIAIPRGCAIEQIAIQRSPDFPEEKYFTINDDLWQRLDEAGKAGLVLHEIVFREALERGHVDSIQTRYFNALVTSKGFVPENAKRYTDVTKQMKFAMGGIGFRGLYFRINNQLVWHPNGFVQAGQLGVPGKWVLPSGMEIGLVDLSVPTFHANGQLASGNIIDETVFPLEDGTSVTSIAGYGIDLDAEGRLTGAHLGLTPTTYAIGAYTVTITHNVYIHEGRHVTGGYLKAPLAVTLCGRSVTLEAPVTVQFDDTRSHLAYLGDVRKPTMLCFRNPTTGALDSVEVKTGGSLDFDAEGAVRRIHVNTGGLVRDVQGLQLNLFGSLSFHANGGVAKAQLNQPFAKLRTTAGEFVTKSQGQSLAFDVAGLLIVP